jgi:hypothetical protein
MDENRGTEGVGAEQMVRVDGRQFLNPDSALVQTALDLLTTHVIDAEGESTRCAHCGQGYPCPTVQHARQVVNAGGLARSNADPNPAADDGPADVDTGDIKASDIKARDPVAAV